MNYIRSKSIYLKGLLLHPFHLNYYSLQFYLIAQYTNNEIYTIEQTLEINNLKFAITNT